jgi:regulator of nucleoside diphosphate kinase
MHNEIVITDSDIQRLEQLLDAPVASSDGRLGQLEHELNRAEVVSSDEVSTQVVTMNSRVRVHDLDRRSEFVCTLVYPAEANADQKKVSVLAPLGLALLGCHVGQLVQFSAPGGPRRVKVTSIEYQPESASREHREAAQGIA